MKFSKAMSCFSRFLLSFAAMAWLCCLDIAEADGQRMDAPKLAGFSSRMVRGEWPPVSIAFVKGNGEDGNSGEPSIAGMEWGREMLAELDRIVSEPIDGNGTAIDGKASRCALNAGERVPCLVNAWSAANRLMLGGERVSGKENEIAAIPRVLGWLDIRGALVSADAIACQKKIAALIRRKGGDYLLALKANHSVFRDEMQRWIEGVPLRRDGTAVDAFETRERAHGRDEWRKCRLVKRPCGFDSAEGWQDLAYRPGRDPPERRRQARQARKAPLHLLARDVRPGHARRRPRPLGHRERALGAGRGLRRGLLPRAHRPLPPPPQFPGNPRHSSGFGAL